jgi:hypothetical protein
MTNTMSPSMTNEQLNKLLETLRPYVQKNGKSFSSATVQLVLESKGLAKACFEPFRALVEAQAEMFTRTVTVNRVPSSLAAFESITSHKKFLNETVVTGMPLGTEEEVTLHFFPIKKQMTCTEYAAALESHGLKPDPMAQAAFNQANPSFADKCPNGTQWQNEAGKFCCALWSGWHGYRSVDVDVFERSLDWNDYWFACGVSK